MDNKGILSIKNLVVEIINFYYSYHIFLFVCFVDNLIVVHLCSFSMLYIQSMYLDIQSILQQCSAIYLHFYLFLQDVNNINVAHLTVQDLLVAAMPSLINSVKSSDKFTEALLAHSHALAARGIGGDGSVLRDVEVGRSEHVLTPARTQCH